MTDCYPKHPKVFGKRVHKQELFESPKFMPQECPARKTKGLMESCRKEEEERCMDKPFSYISRTGNRLDLNKYDKTNFTLTRQTAVGVPDKPQQPWEGIQEREW